MLLEEGEIRRSLELAKAAFPRFGEWDYNNEVNESYPGFALWGEFVPDPDDSSPRHFFVTFDIYAKKWKGTLSIGQHSYFWSSADFGDAVLLDAEPCATLEMAIATLKMQIGNLFAAFSNSAAQTEAIGVKREE